MKSQDIHLRISKTFAQKTMFVHTVPIDLIKKEVAIMTKLSHTHIVLIVATYSDDLKYSIVMDPVADMDLARYPRSRNLKTFIRSKPCVAGLAALRMD